MLLQCQLLQLLRRKMHVLIELGDVGLAQSNSMQGPVLLDTRDQTYGTAQTDLLGCLLPHMRKHSSS